MEYRGDRGAEPPKPPYGTPLYSTLYLKYYIPLPPVRAYLLYFLQTDFIV